MTQQGMNNKTQKQNPKQIRRERELTETAISTASFCMSGNISALLMMIFLVGGGESGMGLAVKAPAMFFFVSSLIGLDLSLSLSDNLGVVGFW